MAALLLESWRCLVHYLQVTRAAIIPPQSRSPPPQEPSSEGARRKREAKRERAARRKACAGHDRAAAAPECDLPSRSRPRVCGETASRSSDHGRPELTLNTTTGRAWCRSRPTAAPPWAWAPMRQRWRTSSVLTAVSRPAEATTSRVARGTRSRAASERALPAAAGAIVNHQTQDKRRLGARGGRPARAPCPVSRQR